MPARERILFATLISATCVLPLAAQDWVQKRFMGRRLLSAPDAVAYDSGRDRLVVRREGRTWEWNGTTWSDRGAGPGPVAGPMAYDAARQRVVAFDGETWEWDGARWAKRSTTGAPRYAPYDAMAYDPVRQRVVLFGGRDPTFGSSLGEHWEWDGTSWVQPTGSTPPGSLGCAMTWDPVRQRIVLFGGARYFGYSGTFRFQDALWEWDGSTWSVVPASSRPPARRGHGLTFDTARQRLVVFGGDDRTLQSGGTFGDTWEWDGTAWRQAATPGAPSPRTGAALAFHRGRGRAVLFGGGNTDEETWEWDGTAWRRASAAHEAPPLRSGLRLAYDRVRARMVMYGGQGRSGTWEWDGYRWWQAAPAASPPSASPAAMAYDAARARVVYFCQAETWEWDGAAWTQHNPVHAPPSGSAYEMVPDPVLGRMLMIVFLSPPNGSFETWQWDGTDWRRLLLPSSPPAGSYAMALDRSRGRAVLFGRSNGAPQTWEWDGGTWLQRAPATAPPPHYGHRMAFDEARGRVVLYGGDDGNRMLDQTWEWDGTDWLRVRPERDPGPRSGFGMAYDSARRRTVLFGGAASSPETDTWLYASRINVAGAGVFGAGCSGAGDPPRLGAYGSPMLGNAAFALDMATGETMANGAFVLAVQEASIPLGGGCTLLVEPGSLLLGVPVRTNAAGFASLPLAIPRDPAASGLRLTAQGVVTAPAGAWMRLDLTAGLAMRIGE